MAISSETLALGGGALALATAGLIGGLVIETHTNDVARQKVITAEACHQGDPDVTEVSRFIIACVAGGVPGGTSINSSQFYEGESIIYFNSYVTGQKNEAAHIEPSRIAAWTAAPLIFQAAGWSVVAGCEWLSRRSSKDDARDVTPSSEPV
jgi:hypothetical protein